MSSSKFIPERAVSQKYGLGLQTLRNWRSLRKYLNYYKIGRKVLYNDDEVASFFEKHRIVVDD